MCIITTIYTHLNNVNSDEAFVNINSDRCTTHFCTGRQTAGACEKPVLLLNHGNRNRIGSFGFTNHRAATLINRPVKTQHTHYFGLCL